MSDISRHVRRSSSPEVFGLSTLDTVSCALGGAIILMILMSSFIERGAPVQITEYRQIFQKGDGDPEPPPVDPPDGGNGGGGKTVKLSNLATLFLDFEGTGASTEDLKPTLSSSAGCTRKRVSILKPPSQHYPDEHASVRWALVIWADTGCKSFTLDLELKSMPPACTATLVSGAHFDVKSFRPCHPRFRLRGSGNQVYVFRRVP